MTIPEIWNLLNQITPNKPVYELACSMASLDTKTILELIEKWKIDQEATEKRLKQELQDQRMKKYYEL